MNQRLPQKMMEIIHLYIRHDFVVVGIRSSMPHSSAVRSGCGLIKTAPFFSHVGRFLQSRGYLSSVTWLLHSVGSRLYLDNSPGKRNTFDR